MAGGSHPAINASCTGGYAWRLGWSSPIRPNESSAARYRNYYWEHAEGRAKRYRTATRHQALGYHVPRPSKDQPINDEPSYDRGGGVGRFARGSAMKSYIDDLLGTELVSIALRDWMAFLMKFGQEPEAEEQDEE